MFPRFKVTFQLSVHKWSIQLIVLMVLWWFSLHSERDGDPIDMRQQVSRTQQTGSCQRHSISHIGASHQHCLPPSIDADHQWRSAAMVLTVPLSSSHSAVFVYRNKHCAAAATTETINQTTGCPTTGELVRSTHSGATIQTITQTTGCPTTGELVRSTHSGTTIQTITQTTGCPTTGELVRSTHSGATIQWHFMSALHAQKVLVSG